MRQILVNPRAYLGFTVALTLIIYKEQDDILTGTVALYKQQLEAEQR